MLGLSPGTFLTGAVAVMAAGYIVYSEGRHQIDMRLAVERTEKQTRLDTQIAERNICDGRIASLVSHVNGTADAEVAGGDEAAALVPRLKDRDELMARCAESPFCRSNLIKGE